MTIKEVLQRAREILGTNNVEDASLESEVLLRDALKISRVELYQKLDQALSPEQEGAFWHLVKRRLSREPTAYIIGHREFYGLDFCVSPDVLIPRPESELLVAKTLEMAQGYAVSTIAEVGTGCGAITISIALNLPQVKIYAIDISTAALKIALLNCQKHGVADRISLLAGDMLEPLPQPVDLIVANLPYVKEAELPGVATLGFEPLLSLSGGSDGLEKICQLCTQVSGKLHPGGYLLLEIGQGQKEAVATLLRSLFPSAKLAVAPDLRGVDRVVILTLPSESVVDQTG